MREDLLYYGNVDGLAPQGRCSLHRHPNDVVVDHRFNSGSVRWMPYAEEKLKVAYESKENAPRVALLGAECLEHPLLPNASFHSFLSNNLASPYIMPKKAARATVPNFSVVKNFQSYSCVATHCAGLIGAKSTGAFSGLAPDCDLLCLQVIGKEGYATASALVKAIQFAVEEKVQIICIPFSLPIDEDEPNQQLAKTLLKEAASSGILIIAAKTSTEPCFPADESFVCSVVPFNRRYILSDPLEDINCADVAAPGEGLWSLHPIIHQENDTEGEENHYFCRMSGSAMATSLVAGLAARLVTRTMPNIIYNFREFLRVGILNISVHSYPLNVKHLLDSKSYPIDGKPNEGLKKEGGIFCSPLDGNHALPKLETVETKQEEIKKEEIQEKEEDEKIKIEKEEHEDALVKALSPRSGEIKEERDRSSKECQQNLYDQIIESLQKGDQDPFLLVRMKQHQSLIDRETEMIQRYSIPDTTQGSAAYYKYFSRRVGPTLGFIDWALGYICPFTQVTVEDGKKKIRGNLSTSEEAHEVNVIPEVIQLLLSKRLSRSRLRDNLWRVLQDCKGYSYDQWVISPDNYPPNDIQLIIERIGCKDDPSEITSSKIYLKRSIDIPNIWEFCARLMTYEGIIDAEPLFLETEYHLRKSRSLGLTSSSVLVKKTDPNYELVNYLGIEPHYDLSSIGDDINIAFIDTHFQKHECITRGNIQYGSGWDYIRNQVWDSLSDTWTIGNIGNNDNDNLLDGKLNPTGAHGLSNLSTILGAKGVADGISPNSTIIPIRSFHESVQLIERDNSSNLIFSGVYKSVYRLTEAINHARKVKSDIISINFGVVTPGFIGSLRRVIRAAENDNIIICAAVGEFVKFASPKTKSLPLYPPGGSVNSPARYSETIGVGSCGASDSPWTFACCGPQVDILSLVESVVVAADRSEEIISKSGARGISSTSLATPTIAALAALWISYHGKKKLLKIYNDVVSLTSVFKYILYHSSFMTKNWNNQTRKLFGNGTTRNCIGSIFNTPLPTRKAMREFVGTRKRTHPQIFGLDFATSDVIQLFLEREINHLYYTQSYLRTLQRQLFYQELLGGLSTVSQQELVNIIGKLPYMRFEPTLGISMVSGEFLITTTGQVMDISKEMNLIQKVEGEPVLAHFAPPSGVWRSVFYVGKDSNIHQLFWYQSIRHWIMTLFYKNITAEFGGAEAKRTSGPVAFRDNTCYFVYYIGLSNRIHLLRSIEQTKIWHHQILELTSKGFPLYVHPECGTLQRNSNENPTCVVFKVLTKTGGWTIHHIIAHPGLEYDCPSSIPHHLPEMVPIE